MMTIEGLIAVVSLVLTAFGLGYTIGSNTKKCMSILYSFFCFIVWLIRSCMTCKVFQIIF